MLRLSDESLILLGPSIGVTLQGAAAEAGFQVEDENDTSRAVLKLSQDTPQLALADKNGAKRAVLSVLPDSGQTLIFGDASGQPRLLLGSEVPNQRPDGRRALGQMLDFYAEGEFFSRRGQLSLTLSDRTPQVIFSDTNAQPRLQFVVAPEIGAAISTYDADGNPKLLVP